MSKRERLEKVIFNIAALIMLIFLFLAFYVKAVGAQDFRTHPREDNLLELHIRELQTPETRALLVYPELGTYTGQKKEPCGKPRRVYRVYDPNPVNRDRNRWLWRNAQGKPNDKTR